MEDERGTRAGGERLRIGPSAERLGLSPRMIRYLEEHGVLRPERGPGPRGHRHFPPPELTLGAAAARSLDRGYSSGVLRALRELADRKVAAAVADDDLLAWFELLAIARAVDAVVREQAPPPPPPPGPPDAVGPPRGPIGTRGHAPADPERDELGRPAGRGTASGPADPEAIAPAGEDDDDDPPAGWR